jgi:hypothetical protein
MIIFIVYRNNCFDHYSTVINLLLNNNKKVLILHNYEFTKKNNKSYLFPKIEDSPFYKKINVISEKFYSEKDLQTKIEKYNFNYIITHKVPPHDANDNFYKLINKKWCILMHGLDIFDEIKNIEKLKKNVDFYLLIWSKFFLKRINKLIKKNKYSYNYYKKNIKSIIIGCPYYCKPLSIKNQKKIKKKYNIPYNKKILIYLPYPLEIDRVSNKWKNGWQFIFSGIGANFFPKSIIKNLIKKIYLFVILIIFNTKYILKLIKRETEHTIIKKINYYCNKNNYYFIIKGRLKYVQKKDTHKYCDKVIYDYEKKHSPSIIEELYSIADLNICYSSGATFKAALYNVYTLNIKSDMQDWLNSYHFEFFGFKNKFFNCKGVVKSYSIKEFIKKDYFNDIPKKKNFSFFKKNILGTPIKKKLLF